MTCTARLAAWTALTAPSARLARRRQRAPARRRVRAAAADDGVDEDETTTATTATTTTDDDETADALDESSSPFVHPYESAAMATSPSPSYASSPYAAASANASAAATASPPPPPKIMTPFQTSAFHVGYFSTAVLIAWGVKKGVDAFNAIPDLSTEERLVRMDEFATAQLARVNAMPPGKARDAEARRLEKMRDDIRRKRKKFEAAEARREEWNARLRRLDERGNPVGRKEAVRRAEDAALAAGIDEKSERRRELDAAAAAAARRSEAAEARAAPPGAGADDAGATAWVDSSAYLESVVEKDVEGGDEEEEEILEVIPPPVAAASAPAKKKTKTKPPPPPKLKPKPKPKPKPRRAPKTPTPNPATPKPTNKTIFDPEIVDTRDDLTNIPGLTPERERELDREIRELEQRYGDDPNVSPEELDARCNAIIEKYGLGDKAFTENEMYDPDADPEMAARHYSEVDPYYWRDLKTVHAIFEANAKTKEVPIMTMMMTHPGLPAYLPGGKKPENKVRSACALVPTRPRSRFSPPTPRFRSPPATQRDSASDAFRLRRPDVASSYGSTPRTTRSRSRTARTRSGSCGSCGAREGTRTRACARRTRCRRSSSSASRSRRAWASR